MMKVIIAGSRGVTDYTLVEQAIRESGFNITEVVSGGARGVDLLGEEWAKKQGKDVVVFKANWDLYGRTAGPRRNQEMGDYADALIAVWDGKSNGTRHMVEYARKKNLKVHVKVVGRTP